MSYPRRGRLLNARSTRSSLRKPFWITVIGTQADPGEILLAYHVEGCHCLRQSLQQVSEVWQPHLAANKGTHSNDGPMAFRLVGIGHHGSIPNSNLTTKIPGGRYSLLHQVGRSRNSSYHNEEECVKLCVEKHHL